VKFLKAERNLNPTISIGKTDLGYLRQNTCLREVIAANRHVDIVPMALRKTQQKMIN